MKFASDNGYMFGEHRWLGKIVPYEESIRVPIVVRDDAVIPSSMQGTSKNRQVTSLDYTTTFMQAAGLDGSALDGESVLPLLGGDGTWTNQSTVLIEHGNNDNEDLSVKVPAYCGVRTPDFMYAQYITGEEELYDLSVDPNENTNVATDPNYATALQVARDETHQLCDPTPPGFVWTH